MKKQANSSSSKPLNLTPQVKNYLTGVIKQAVKQAVTPIPSKGKFSHEREDGLKQRYTEYRDNVLADYIYGLYHPDVVFRESLDIKSPSYMPVPTTSFKFKETFNVTPNSYGNFVLYWYPNFLGTSAALEHIHAPDGTVPNSNTCYFSTILCNTSQYLDGNTELLDGWRAQCFKHVQQDFEKYRLTSACLKVKYTGKVLDQSGMLAAAASYVKSYRTVYGVLATGEPRSGYDLPAAITKPISQFCDFDNIRQGQWADTCSLVSDPDGLTCVYVPTDPLNQVFVDNATTIDSINHRLDYDATGWLRSFMPTNANISYAVAGYGIANASTCITVEAYYNYEIIVRQEQYPYFSPRVAHPKYLEHKDTLTRIVDMTTANGLITHTKSHNKSTVWTSVRNAFQKAANVATEVYPYIKPLISSLI